MDSRRSMASLLFMAVMLGALRPRVFRFRKHRLVNTSALAGLLTGYSGVRDSAHIVHSFWALAAALRCEVWSTMGKYMVAATLVSGTLQRAAGPRPVTWQPASTPGGQVSGQGRAGGPRRARPGRARRQRIGSGRT